MKSHSYPCRAVGCGSHDAPLGSRFWGTCEQRSLFALSIPSLESLRVIPSPVLTPWVVWGKLILSGSCLESETSAESPEPSREAEPADEEESALHCLWVDKFTPRRYMELLSDDVRC